MQTAEEHARTLARLVHHEPLPGQDDLLARVQARDRDVRQDERSLAEAERIEIIWKARRDERRKALLEAAEVCTNPSMLPPEALAARIKGRINDLLAKHDAEAVNATEQSRT